MLRYLQVTGIRSRAPAVLQTLLAGEEVDPADYEFRTAIRIETADERIAAMQRSISVASCVRAASIVAFRAYRLA